MKLRLLRSPISAVASNVCRNITRKRIVPCMDRSFYRIRRNSSLRHYTRIDIYNCLIFGSGRSRSGYSPYSALPPGLAKTPFFLGGLRFYFGFIFAYLCVCVSACSPLVFKCTSDCDNHPISLSMDLEW
jgi:hypothetical protein